MPGLYLFAQPGGLLDFGWRVTYVGETDDFATRIDGHEKWLDAVALGATHVGICPLYSANERWLVEREMITSYCPPLNVQHNLLARLLDR